MKPAVVSPAAEADLVQTASYYRIRHDEALARRFIARALAALKPIERRPGIGSSRIGEMCDVPNLRSWQVKGFPVRWYYFEGESNLTVVRLLSDAQDLASILGEIHYCSET